ncbi:MAG TPA: glutamate--tRNA ligase [Nitrospiria bacterium]|nr:glutamate--tRNA ligase [Nitrospiria bacterium]
MGNVRVRFAPSPTGYLHIGGVRTALFNWLYARHHQGTFILRIEDTDRSRSTEESITAILEGMKWLGLDWDEAPYRQTDRLELYRSHSQRLLQQGIAYPCYCTPEELEQRRKEALAKALLPRYDGRCRELKTPPPDRPAAIRFKAPQVGQTIVEDLVKGHVVFENNQLDDLILLRADGLPTYNFAVVVDDIDMKITHVIRGDDHLNNTPRQIQLYQALGSDPPRFAHLPMILGPDKSRLSKRHGATSVEAYRQMGYLPEAVVNYLARLGWSHGDQEVFSRLELIEKFSLEPVGKSASIFNPEKLLWLNAHYIKTAEPERLGALLGEYLTALKGESLGQPLNPLKLREVAAALKERAKTLVEMAEMASCYFLRAELIEIDQEAKEKFLNQKTRPILQTLHEVFSKASSLDQNVLEPIFKDILIRDGLKMNQLAQPLRVALTGKSYSPGIYDVLNLMGKQKALEHLDRAIREAQKPAPPGDA